VCPFQNYTGCADTTTVHISPLKDLSASLPIRNLNFEHECEYHEGNNGEIVNGGSQLEDRLTTGPKIKRRTENFCQVGVMKWSVNSFRTSQESKRQSDLCSLKGKCIRGRDFARYVGVATERRLLGYGM
jgi:hypothetical protein